jgi:secreted PhoX family phosphatase
MGDDEADEYLYKFISRGKAGPDALDAGTLYVAQFQEGHRGRWIPLTPEHPRLAGWHPAAILVYARQAADAVEATPMDRPEWVAVDPRSGRAYCTMTNNVDRLAPTPGSPRPGNVHGHIVWWQEDGGDPAAASFEWDLFVLAGDPASGDPALQGNIRGDLFSSADGLAFDDRGALWIQTDMSSSRMWHPQLAPERQGFQAFGNNQMLAVDPAEGKIRRFLTGPVGAEITGFTLTPDGKTLFVNVQHPGEPLASTVGSDPANPTRWSSWPDGHGRPRSSTLAITREDGGVIGT